MLDRIDEQNLTPNAIPTYEYIRNILSVKQPSFSLGATVALEGYLHTNTTDFTTNDDWYYNHDDWYYNHDKRKALLSIPMEISLANHFYAYADHELTFGKFDAIISPIPYASPVTGSSLLYGKQTVTTNMQLLEQIDANVPYRAFVA